MFTACKHHVEQVIDEFVDRFNLPPDVYLADEYIVENVDVPAKCSLCPASPTYVLVRTDSERPQ